MFPHKPLRNSIDYPYSKRKKNNHLHHRKNESNTSHFLMGLEDQEDSEMEVMDREEMDHHIIVALGPATMIQ